MKPLITVIVLIIAVPILALGFAWSGLYNVTATSPHTAPVEWLLDAIARQSIKRHARAVAVPDLDDENLVLAGINDFEGMCVGCHGAPGRPRDAAGQGLMPPPPDLADSATRLSPAELFWVTKNGIRMTGMPAWGYTHGDAELWPVVAFLLGLPKLDEAGYRHLLALSQGHGHHAAPAPDGAGGHRHDDPPAEGAHDHPAQDVTDADEEDHAHDDHDHRH